MGEFINKLRVPNYFKFLIGLSKFKKQCFTISEIELYFGYLKPKIDLRKLCSYLIELNIITFNKKIVGVNFYNINIKLLDKFIKDTDFYIMIANYIKFKDPLLYQP